MIDWTADQSDKFIGTAAAILGLIAAGTAGATSVYAAHKQSDTAEKAAQLTSDAAKYGADAQTKASQAAETFARQQAENAYQNSQTTQKANYGQSKARFDAIAGVGAQYGLSGLSMPDYVPGVDPHYDTGATAVPDGTLGAAAGVTAPATGNLSDPAAWMSLVGDKQKLSQWVQSQGITDPSLAGYYVQKIQGQPGANPTEQAGSANYWAQKIKSDPSLGGGGAQAAPKAATLGSFVSPTYAPLAPTTALPTPYQPGTIGAYLRRA